MEKSNIDQRYYQKIGGDITRPPYIDVGNTPSILGVPTGSPKVRVFVSTLWYPTWEEWRQAADVAVDTALMGVNPFVSAHGITISSAAELEKSPSFLFDHAMRKYGSLAILLNAASITEEREFDATLIVAEARRRVIEKKLAAKGKESRPDEFTKYSICQNGTVYAWTDMQAEARAEKRCSIFDRDPAEERREQLIKELMRLDMEK